jgi:hypothetical protein
LLGTSLDRQGRRKQPDAARDNSAGSQFQEPNAPPHASCLPSIE